jgi:hypothetical protein
MYVITVPNKTVPQTDGCNDKGKLFVKTTGKEKKNDTYSMEED